MEVRWQAGAASTRLLDGSDSNRPSTYARVRYLSQQFVEDLCSSSGLSDRLLEEIERVIFEAHPMETRDGEIDFAELLEERSQRYRLARQREAQAVGQISDHIATELEKERFVSSTRLRSHRKLRLSETTLQIARG